jgi:SAM-dependent methyltransferase
MLPPKERFSSRVHDYVRYRPTYPHEVLTLLQKECGLTRDWTIADIGSGPGNLSRMFLANGNTVYGVEPNKEMREAGELLLGDQPNFISVDGSAEETSLESNAIDLITAAQAFHWFNQSLAKEEFKRVLKPGGWVALIWNMRKTEGNRFMARYQQVLSALPEYKEVRAEQAPIEPLKRFLSPGELHTATFYNEQRFELDPFLGRGPKEPVRRGGRRRRCGLPIRHPGLLRQVRIVVGGTLPDSANENLYLREC